MIKLFSWMTIIWFCVHSVKLHSKELSLYMCRFFQMWYSIRGATEKSTEVLLFLGTSASLQPEGHRFDSLDGDTLFRNKWKSGMAPIPNYQHRCALEWDPSPWLLAGRAGDWTWLSGSLFVLLQQRQRTETVNADEVPLLLSGRCLC